MTDSPFTFNLVDAPWIPCIPATGGTEELSLREALLRSHHLRAIAGDSPLVTAALYRLLLAILHRVFGPQNADAWAGLWKAKSWDETALNRYLDTWKPRFDLFDAEHPFYQAPDKRVKPKSTINLSHDRASGNNPTLFDHHTEEMGETLTPAQAARFLLTAQAYGLAGLSGIKQTFTDGTLASGIVFLLQGDTLRQTLLLNMLPYPPDNDLFSVQDEDDHPAWEMDDPFTPNRAIPFGYLDYLTWQNRKVLFLPERINGATVVRKMTMGPGLRYDPSVLDPMKNYRIHEKLGPLAYSFSEDRVFWRDSAALFAFKGELAKKAIPPATLRWLQHLIEETSALKQHQMYRLLAIGMSKKQAKVYFFRQEQLPVPLDYLTDEDLVHALDAALNVAGTVAFDLLQAARLTGMHRQLPVVEQKWQKQWAQLSANAKSDINNWIAHTGMERAYWSGLDLPFQSFIVALARDRENAVAEWRSQLRKAALDAFRLISANLGSDARAFKAQVAGEGYLHYRLSKIFENHEKETAHEA